MSYIFVFDINWLLNWLFLVGFFLNMEFFFRLLFFIMIIYEGIVKGFILNNYIFCINW